MTRAKPGLVVNFGLSLVVAWALAVAASEPSARELYFECCARCHGEPGQGNGSYANELPNRPRNFTDCKTMGAIPDDVLFKAIKKVVQRLGYRKACLLGKPPSTTIRSRS
jgi:hypothetical protein